MVRTPFSRLCTVLALSLAAVSLGCTDDAEPGGPKGFDGSGGSGGSSSCPTEFTFVPTPGTAPGDVALAGEWNEFDETATLMEGPDPSGAFKATVDLPPGLHGYKVVLNGEDWILDPDQGYRKYVGGVENSGKRVVDCAKPSLKVESKASERGNPGAGTYVATLSFVPALSGATLSSARASLESQGMARDVTASAVSIDGSSVNVDLATLADGKHTLMVTAVDADGAESEPARLVFWVEEEAFDWNDALIYMIMTDRYKDGDPSNNASVTAEVQDDRGDFKNGDFEGVRQKIADGTLDKLGIRAIWLTPFHTNPDAPYLASDGFHMVTGYHGYWPTKAREVDPRLGGAEALRAMVNEAHKHGIRILMDYVVNHVHEDHEYFQEHPDWFRTGCVCGTDGCDWTAQALECLFTPYLPDVNWSVPEAADQFVEDAVWWLDEFDLDGVRVDAVKHVEDIAITNLATRVRGEFEAGGTRYFLMGETAMGWSDCGVDCNKDQYGTISRYIGKHALDGQFDFVLYHAVPERVFAHDQNGMLHADFWTQASLSQYPEGSIMTPFIGSHDSVRFSTLAAYRGQPGFETNIPGNQWDNVAGPAQDAEPFYRHRAALGWLMGLPGAPLLYYGDEYGEWGGADPGNRNMWRGDSTNLNAEELMLLEFTRKAGTARQELKAMRRGGYRSLFATETVLVIARQSDDGAVAIVGSSRDQNTTTQEVDIPASLGLVDGTVLRDRMGGPDVSVSGAKVSITIEGRNLVILAP